MLNMQIYIANNFLMESKLGFYPYIFYLTVLFCDIDLTILEQI